MTNQLLEWLDRHARALLWALAAVFVLSHVLLAAYSPWAYGYIYDPYWDAVQKLSDTGRIPASTECWECYQPPLYLLVSLPFYEVGRLLWPTSPWPHDNALRLMQAVPLLSSIVCLWYTYRLLRLFRYRGAYAALGIAVAAALPVLFLSSYSLEPDLLVGAIVTMFVYHLTRWYVRPGARPFASAAWLGVLAGLAAATKYSGLVAAVVAVILVGANVIAGPLRRRALGQVTLFLLVAATVGSWKYVDNVRHFGTPFYATGSAADGFRLASAPSHRDLYEFTTFRMPELLALTRPDAPPGMLTVLPVYRSVWTTLHGLMWGDMGFFTNPTRHGTGLPLYQDRHIAPWLASSVLLLGLLPTWLAGVGFVRTLRRRRFRPVALLCLVGLAIYLRWMVAQEWWAIKAKYLLFLLPAYVLYMVVGTRWAVRVLPGWASTTIVASILALVVLANLYLFSFAIG